MAALAEANNQAAMEAILQHSVLHQLEAEAAEAATADKTDVMAAPAVVLVVKANQTRADQAHLDKVFQEVEKALSATVTAVAVAAKAALAETQEQEMLVNQVTAALEVIFHHISEQVTEKVVTLQVVAQEQ